MKSLKHLVPLILLIINSCGSLFSQESKVSLSGRIKDSSGQALPYATVSLYKIGAAQQPAYVSYTDSKGVFAFSKLDTGRYRLGITNVNFQDFSKSIVLKDGATPIETIILQPLSATMKEVKVVGRKPLVEMADDKIIYNAESDPAAKTEMAIDVLRKAPFVTVDGDGNIQVNGQSSFKVLLNGKETGMFSQNPKDALKGFPGAMITRIEVITSPSAKYDAEGLGGVINIITPKNVIGYNGSVSAFLSTLTNYSTSANINLKKNHFGLTAFYSRSGNGWMHGYNTIETVPLARTIFTRRAIDGARTSNYLYQFGNMEASYEIDSFRAISLYGTLNGSTARLVYDQSIHTEYENAPPSSDIFTQNTRYENPGGSIGADFIHTYRVKEKEFNMGFTAQFGKSKGFNNSEQDGGGLRRFLINTTDSRNREYTFQSNYVLPLSRNRKLEVGVKSILRNASSDFQSLGKYDPADEYLINPANSNVFRYEQEVYGLYGTYNFRIKKYIFRTGVRFEHTNIDGKFVSTGSFVKQRYGNFIPNVQITRKWNATLTSILNYNLRLQRPYINNLNPFVNNNDSLNISFGNPDLGPQTTQSLSVQTRITKGKTVVGIILTGSYSNNAIQQMTVFDKATGITSNTFGNIGEEYQLIFGVTLNAALNKDWRFSFNGQLRYSHVQSNIRGFGQRGGIGGNLNANTSYNVSSRITISANGGLFKGPYTLNSNGFFSGYYQSSVAYRLFNGKLSVNLNFNNVFLKDRTIRYVVDDSNFRTTNLNTMPYRVLFVGLTWNFGKLKENVSKKKGIVNDDLIGAN